MILGYAYRLLPMYGFRNKEAAPLKKVIGPAPEER